MMNVVFVYPDFTRNDCAPKQYGSYHFGIASMAGVARDKGHNVSLLHYLSAPEKKAFIYDLQQKSPDVVCFSYTEENLQDVREWCSWIDECHPRIITIAGGAFPTLSPEKAIAIKGADVICRGEGEAAFGSFLDRLSAGRDFSDIESLWVKTSDSVVVRNPVGPLEINIDSHPIPHINIFDHEKLATSNSKLKRIYFKASRGCPFNCSYCASPAIRGLYPNQEHYVRFYSPDRTIQILERLVKLNPGVKTVQFVDDILPYRLTWFREFAESYRARIGLPYRCYVHLGLINRETVDLLKMSGCYRVNCGIESGSPRILNSVYRRSVTLSRMTSGLSLLKSAGLQIHGSSIVGYYDETMQDVSMTLKFVAANPIDIPVVSILNPYDGTKINSDLGQKGCLKGDVSFLNCGSRIKLKCMTEQQAQYVFSTFRMMVLIYRVLFSLPVFIRAPLERVVDALYAYPRWPFKMLNVIHDRWFNQLILSRCYAKLEAKYRAVQ